MKLNRRSLVRLENLHRRFEHWLPEPHELPPLSKRLLLIRPTVRRDYVTRITHGWAEDIKTRAIAEGWEVEDLARERATRGRVEASLSRTLVEHRPRLILHYDHGSEFTLYGHAPALGPRRDAIDALAAAIDEANVEMTAGMFVSAVACLSASGLGPLSVWSRASGYLGYASLVGVSVSVPERFGEAVNAPNYALLEGRDPAEAYQLGWQAWDQLASQLRDEASEAASELDRFLLRFESVYAEANRDSLTLLQP